MSEHFLGLNFLPFTSLLKTGLVTFRWLSVNSARVEESILILYEHLLPFCIYMLLLGFAFYRAQFSTLGWCPLYLKTSILWLVEGCIVARETCPFSDLPVGSLWFLLLYLKVHAQAFEDITDKKWIISFVSTMILSIGNELRNLCYCPPSYIWLNKKVKVKCTLYRHWGSVQAVWPIGE
jgi:hypothetical protein